MPAIADIPAPPTSAPRYTSRPFPAYRYVPGLHPHPTRDPRGHSYEPNPRLHRHAAWQSDQWRTLDDWLYGVDLFNAHFFWEAHEAWEGLWAVAARDSAPALLLQGLIQIAAALLKNHMGVIAGVAVLSHEGLEKLYHVSSQQPQLMGLNLVEIVAAFRSYFEPVARGERPAAVQIPALRLAP